MSTTPKKPYRGLIVDFGGVLSTSFEGALQSFCVREGLAPNALEQVFSLDDGAKGLLVDLECGLVGQAEFVAHLAATLRVNSGGLLERMVAELRLEPKVTNAVQQVRQQGVRVAVLSNSWGSHPFDPYRPFRLAEQFDAVVISDQVGLRKPDPKIFTLTAERLGLPQQNVSSSTTSPATSPQPRSWAWAQSTPPTPTPPSPELSLLFPAR